MSGPRSLLAWARGFAWLPISLDVRAVSLAEGVRAALSTSVIVALNGWLHVPALSQSALAALLTCLCDPGGPVWRRVPPLLSFAVLGSLLYSGFGLARGIGYAVIPLAAFGIFCNLFARVYGQSAQLVGNLLTVVLVLALDRPIPSFSAAAETAIAFFGGALWAVLLTLIIWRVHPFGPARRAVGRVYRALADMAADMATRGSGQATWEEHARIYRARVRDAIETARGVVLETLRARGAANLRGTQNLVRLEAADQIFGALIALSETLSETASEEFHRSARHMLRLLQRIFVALAQVIETDATARLAAIERAIGAVRAIGAGEAIDRSGETAISRLVDFVAERLQIALTLSSPSGYLPQTVTENVSRQSLREKLLGPIVANLNWQSASLRHALRAAVIAVPGFAITFTWPGDYEHWLTITLIMTLQPFYSTTLQRALERIGGTVLGGVLAAVLALFCRTPDAIALALFPLAIAALAVRPASFSLFMALLTPLVVLLSELGRPGSSEIQIAALRALYTVIGGGLAVVGNLVLWPSWEPERLQNELAGAITAHRRYAEAVLDFLRNAAPLEKVERARRAAGVASNNLEASLARAVQEPGQNRQAFVQDVIVISAALRRMAGRLSALQISPGTLSAKEETALRSWRDWISDAMAALVQTPIALPPRPRELPPGGMGEALARIARQIELVAGILRRSGVSSEPEVAPMGEIRGAPAR